MFLSNTEQVLQDFLFKVLLIEIKELLYRRKYFIVLKDICINAQLLEDFFNIN